MRYQRDAIDFSKMTCIPLNGIGLDQRNQSVQSDFVRCLYVPGKTQNEKKQPKHDHRTQLNAPGMSYM